MGWMNCGADSRGRPIGYGHPAICDQPGCNVKIYRGLSYVCGDMHGEDEISCEKYFCEKHLIGYVEIDDSVSTRLVSICNECAKTMLEDASDIWEYDEDEGVFREKKGAA